METNEISKFMNFIFRAKKEDIFIDGFNKNIEGTICGIKFDSNVLFLLQDNINDLNVIKNYHKLKYIEINNYKIGKKEDNIFAENINILKNVTHLNIWNIKQNDLEILKYFPQLTHLLVSYIRKDDFSFTGLNYVKKINTLCFISVNRIKDFNFLDKGTRNKIRNMSVEYCKELIDFTGIADYKNMECLRVCASTPESGKRIQLRNFNGLERLNKLKYFELGYYKFDINELKNKINRLKYLQEYIIDYKKYENK
jgi:hypothetical protein